MEEIVFVDANIFLEIFLRDLKAEACKQFLKSLASQQTQAWTTDFIVYTCLIQVQNHLKDPHFLRDVILFFGNYSPLKIQRPSLKEWYTAVDLMKIYKLDFDDSLVVASMQSRGITKLVSLDKHFDKVKFIERIRL